MINRQPIQIVSHHTGIELQISCRWRSLGLVQANNRAYQVLLNPYTGYKVAYWADARISNN